MIKKLLLVVFFLLGMLAARAQKNIPYKVVSLKNYSLGEGLPGTNIIFIFQDSSGFIWIATDKGVSRFDGQHFTNFTASDGLESNEVLRIAEDSYHRIFFYSDNYHISYYENGKIRRLAEKKPIIWPPTASMFFNRYNQLCISYGIYARTYDFPELRVKPHPALGRDRVIYGESGQEFKISAKDDALFSKTLAENQLPEHPDYLKPYRIEAQGNNLLLITKKWVIVYRVTSAGIQPYRRYDIGEDINAVNFAGKNSFTVSTFKKGTYLIDYVRDIRENYLNGAITTHSLIDREGNIWFGTYDSGLYLSTNPKVGIINTSGGLANNSVQKLCVLGNHIFAGHILAGVSYITPLPRGNVVTGNLFINQGRSDFNRITSFLPVQNKYLVIGTDNGVFRMQTDGVEPAQWKPRLYCPGPVKDIALRHDSVCYLTHRTLRVIFDWTKKYGWYDIDSVRITSLAWLHGQPLIGSFYGLYRLKLTPTDNKFITKRILAANGITSVKSLAVTGDVCAIGTEDKGVFVYGHKLLRQFNKPQICSGNIRRLVWMDAHTLWVCTPAGVSIIKFANSYQTQQIVTLNTSTGLPSDNVTDVVQYAGNYYIGTDQGIAVINNIWANQASKPILISESGLNQTFTYGQPIQFNYSALSYKSLGGVQYQFKLKGVDKDWVSSASGNRRFDLLPPGNYQLDAVGLDRFKRQSVPIHTFFTVAPLWYQHTWLQILALLLLTAIGFLLVRGYYQSVIQLQKADFERKLALQQERQRISAEVHDDLGASISGIKLRTEMLSQKVSDETINKEMGAIHEAISDMSTQIRLIIWSLDIDNDDIDSLVVFINRHADKLFEHSATTLHNTTVCETAIAISGEKRRQIYLLVREALNNIIKHADAKNAYLSISVKKRQLLIEVSDDGHGFDTAETHRVSMGIRNIHSRAKRIGAELIINSTLRKGTVLSFKLNLK